jgi:hypothetical protein
LGSPLRVSAGSRVWADCHGLVGEGRRHAPDNYSTTSSLKPLGGCGGKCLSKTAPKFDSRWKNQRGRLLAGLLQLAEAPTQSSYSRPEGRNTGKLLERIYRNRFWRKAFLSAICRKILRSGNHFGSLCKMFIYQEKTLQRTSGNYTFGTQQSQPGTTSGPGCFVPPTGILVLRPFTLLSPGKWYIGDTPSASVIDKGKRCAPW